MKLRAGFCLTFSRQAIDSRLLCPIVVPALLAAACGLARAQDTKSDVHKPAVPKLTGDERQAPNKRPPLTKEQRAERLKERARLWTVAQEQRTAGKLREAIAAVEEVVAIQREVFGAESSNMPFFLGYLAEM